MRFLCKDKVFLCVTQCVFGSFMVEFLILFTGVTQGSLVGQSNNHWPDTMASGGAWRVACQQLFFGECSTPIWVKFEVRLYSWWSGISSRPPANMACCVENGCCCLKSWMWKWLHKNLGFRNLSLKVTFICIQLQPYMKLWMLSRCTTINSENSFFIAAWYRGFF